MRGFLSILDKLPNRLTGAANNFLGVSPCEIQAEFNAGGIPLVSLFVSLVLSVISAVVISVLFLFSPRLSFPVCSEGIYVEIFCKSFSNSSGNFSNSEKLPNLLTLFGSLDWSFCAPKSCLFLSLFDGGSLIDGFLYTMNSCL